MAEDTMFQEAIQAIRQGQRVRARDLLTRLLRADQNNPDYWLWMSSVVDTLKEQVYCLQSVLRLDPENSAAKQGLILLGARAPEGEVVPAPPVRRKWAVELQEVPTYSGLRAMWANPLVRIAFFSFISLLLVGTLILGAYELTRPKKLVAIFLPTRTPGPSPTLTCTPTALNYTPPPSTAKPVVTGPPPLWMRLAATYTPTALYVNTPHVSSSEAFNAAQRALQRNDLNAAMEYFKQAMQMEEGAADIPYYLGEIFRQQGDYQKAKEFYNKSLSVDPDFAPAYLGMARLESLGSEKHAPVKPGADISKYLQLAIEKDPQYGEAYLERASFLLDQGDAEGALKDLAKAEKILPDSPLIYLHRAEIALAEGDMGTALENATRANELDLTLLPSYRLLAEAAAAQGEVEQALEAIDVYLLYEQEDPAAWVIQGQALYARGEYSETMKALNKALQLDKSNTDAYLYRGLTYIELEQGQRAVNDIYKVMQSEPTSFKVNLSFGRALLAAGRLGDSLGQINRSLDLAKSDEEEAQAYYWRARVYEAIGNAPTALRDWKKLLTYPEEAVPQEWIETAQAHIKTTATPAPTSTPTPTATVTRKATSTPTATVLKTPSPTPK